MRKLLFVIFLLLPFSVKAQLSDIDNKTPAQLSAITDDETESDADYWNTHAYLYIQYLNNAIKNRIYDLQDYGSLTGALTDAVADTALLFISNRTTITQDTSIAGTAAIYARQGGRINIPTSGDTLTISVPFVAGDYQVFEGSGTVRFSAGSTPYIRAEWFGAAGDGATDDSAELLKAIASSSGMPIVFMDKTYKIDASINLVSNVDLIGAGQFSTRILSEASDLSDHLFVFNADSHVVVRDMTIELRPNTSAYNIFHFTSAPHHIVLQNLELDSTDAWHINVRGNAHDVLIDNVNMRYSKGAVGDDGIDLAGCYNVRVSNCNINVFDDAIVLKTLDGPTYNITITNCVLSSQIGGGVAIGGEIRSGDIYNVTVSNCVMYRCLAGIYHRGLDSANSYNGNSVYNIAYSNISILADSIGISDYGIRQKVNNTGLQAGSTTRFKKWRNITFDNFTISGEFDFDGVNLDSAYQYVFSNFTVISDTFPSGSGLNRYAFETIGSDNIKIQNGFIGGNLEKYKYGTRTQGWDRNFLIYGSDYVDIYNVKADSSKVSGASDHPCSIGVGSANCTVRFNSFNNPNATNGDGIEFYSGSTFAGNRVQWNVGFVTENDGTATIANGNTSIAVTHGLDVTPEASDVIVWPIETLNTASFYYVDTITSTQFTINVNADPGQDVDFAWKIRTGDQ